MLRAIKTNLVRISMLSASALAMAVATPAVAQAQVRQFDIPAQPLSSALLEFSKQSDVMVLVSPDVAQGKRAPAVRGSLPVNEAIARLLRGSGLKAAPNPGGGYRIERAAATGTSSAASRPSMPSVQVAAADAEGEDAEILVTGSRIRGGQTPSPVVARTREEIEDSGLSNLGEFARVLTQNFSGGQNPGVAGGGNQGGQNNLNSSSALNLRGLGADATLTLINGHRVAYDALNQGVDISAIPIAAIERVEVVTDGASALYGSDAVAGVANIILRRDFNGGELSGRFGAATDGGYVQQQYSAVTGSRWTAGGIMVAADYSRNTAITARQRSYTANLDDSATLVPRARQISFVAAAHQGLGRGIALELDGQFSDRRSSKATPFQTTSNVFTNGNFNQPRVQSFAISPTLRFALPASWRGSVSGTYAESKTDIRSRRFTAGAETSRGQLIYDNRTSSVETGAEGPLFDTGGGAARLALGGGYRRIGLDVNVESTVGGNTSTTTDITVHREVYYGYGELSLPIFGPANRLPLLERLTLSAALRYENYRNVGDVAAPKLGFVYEPVSQITFRGSWGRSFKAPTLNQQFQVRQASLLPGALFTGFPPGRNVLILSGGNPDLKPEKATTWTTSLTVRPIDGLSLEASYFNVRYRDRVVTPVQSLLGAFVNPLVRDYYTLNPTAQQVADSIDSASQGLSNQTGQPFDPASVGAILDAGLVNAASQDVRGVDLTLDYLLDLGPDQSLRFIGNASYLDSEQQLAPGQPAADLAGTIFDPPHWRVRGGATWRRSNVTLSSFINHIGGNLDDRLQPFEQVGAFTSIDVVGRIKSSAASGFFGGIEASFSVINLLNQRPDIIRNSNPADPPYDSTNYPAIGRVVSLTLRKSW